MREGEEEEQKQEEEEDEDFEMPAFMRNEQRALLKAMNEK